MTVIYINSGEWATIFSFHLRPLKLGYYEINPGPATQAPLLSADDRIIITKKRPLINGRFRVGGERVLVSS